MTGGQRNIPHKRTVERTDGTNARRRDKHHTKKNTNKKKRKSCENKAKKGKKTQKKTKGIARKSKEDKWSVRK